MASSGRSYVLGLVFVGYLITSLALIVLGVAWLIRSIGMAS